MEPRKQAQSQATNTLPWDVIAVLFVLAAGILVASLILPH